LIDLAVSVFLLFVVRPDKPYYPIVYENSFVGFPRYFRIVAIHMNRNEHSSPFFRGQPDPHRTATVPRTGVVEIVKYPMSQSYRSIEGAVLVGSAQSRSIGRSEKRVTAFETGTMGGAASISWGARFISGIT